MAIFSIDGAFMSATSELPDIPMQNSINVYQRSNISEIFNEKSTSGYAEMAILERMQKHYF